MHDYKKVIANLDEYKKKMAARGFDFDAKAFVNMVNEVKTLQLQCEALQAQRNKSAREVGKQKQADGNIAVKEDILTLSEQTKVKETALREKENKLFQYLLRMPNLQDDKTPAGKDENDNITVGVYGKKPQFDFVPKEHDVLGKNMGIIDVERGTKLSGARFCVLYNAGAVLDFAIKRFLLDCGKEHGFTPVCVPYMVTRDTAQGTGQLPKFEEEMFKTTSNGQEEFLIPTAEVPVTNLYSGEVLKEETLPINYCALTPCFRVEVGNQSRDTKGIFRQHQFEKVEMVKFVHPDKSWEEFEKLTASARDVLDKLGLHYREVTLCSGDLGFGAAHCDDIEVWLPGQNRYREISSCSNYLDFQARRANIKFKNFKTGKNEFVHTLNGSALPVGRTMVAIMENYQRADGGIDIPKALQPYTGFKTITPDGKMM